MFIVGFSNKIFFMPNPHSQEIPISSFGWWVRVTKTNFSFLQHQPMILNHYQSFKKMLSPTFYQEKKKNLSSCETNTNNEILENCSWKNGQHSPTNTALAPLILLVTGPLTNKVTFSHLLLDSLFVRQR